MSSSIDTVGSFTHSVDDMEIMFDVLRGEDGLDGIAKDFKKREIKK